MKKPTDDQPEEELEEGSPAEEAQETPEEESKEGVKVPEAFQQQCHELLDGCDSMQCLDYVSSAVSDKRQEYIKQEAEENKSSTKEPKSFSDEGMPSA